MVGKNKEKEKNIETLGEKEERKKKKKNPAWTIAVASPSREAFRTGLAWL